MTSFPEPGMCACGEPLHYSDLRIALEVTVLSNTLGLCIPIWLGEHAYLVPRHYIALHGIRAVDLPSSGFATVTREEAAAWGRNFEALKRRTN